MSSSRPLQNYRTSRYGIEIAGNTLYALSKAFSAKADPIDNSYKFLNVRFAQYAKAEYNITHHQIFDKSNRLVYHIGAGVGVPYGNAAIIPYEKRFYSGGANSVRGWSESTLGPGVYQRINNKRRDYNQVGDVKLDMNFEYRTKMFWVLEGAVFVDAGNIWTIKDYETQKGGTFHFNSFAQQIALAYGVGLRFDFSFFIARVDLGVKLFDPAVSSGSQWQTKPTWANDCAVHLAIGYPF
jgi:outer membrane protein assembly factor BamA